nr:autotransporter outer membrane beta-barrel domain-containing protein [Halomonas campisalis]
MGELRAGTTGLSTGGLTLAQHDGLTPSGLYGNVLGAGASGDNDILAFSQWGVFVNGTVSQSRRDTTMGEPGFRRESYGLTAGVDYRLTADTIVGAALGFTRTDTDLRRNAGKVDVNGYSLSLYGTRFLGEAFYVEGIATAGRNRYDTVRTVFVEPIGTQSAMAKPRGNEYGLGLNVGYDRPSGPWTTSYQAGFDYLRTRIDGYTENPSHPDNLGAGTLLNLDSQTIESKTAEAAVQLSYAASQSWGVMHYSGRLGLEHEFGDRSRSITAQFQEDPTNTTFALRTDSPDRTYLNLGAGLTAQMPRGRAAYVFLESVEGRSGYRHYQVDVGFRMEF